MEQQESLEHPRGQPRRPNRTLEMYMWGPGRQGRWADRQFTGGGGGCNISLKPVFLDGDENPAHGDMQENSCSKSGSNVCHMRYLGQGKRDMCAKFALPHIWLAWWALTCIWVPAAAKEGVGRATSPSRRIHCRMAGVPILQPQWGLGMRC